MPASLFDRLGGKTAITAVVADFRKRVEQDPRIDAKFARTDLPRLEAMLVDQVCEATGGPFRYTGRGMREAHQGMGVTTGEFNALVEDLVATLNGFAVPKAEQDELLGILGPLKTEIVEVESTATERRCPTRIALRRRWQCRKRLGLDPSALLEDHQAQLLGEPALRLGRVVTICIGARGQLEVFTHTTFSADSCSAKSVPRRAAS